MEHTKHILEARNLYKHFNEFIAVDGVSFKVKRGGIHALIGPNGAGKTTCFNLLTGFLKPDKGCISFNGHVITATPPEELAQRGLVRSFQISSVFSRMNVLENIQMALLAKEHGYWCFWRSQKILEKYNERAFELLTEVGLEELAHSMAGGLPYGKKRVLELATTLALKPELILLDEPTQGMGHEHIEQITNLIRKVAIGRTVLMVEHNMKVVAGLCDYISVLAQGKVIAEGTYEVISNNAQVQEAYLGKEQKEESSHE